MTSLWQLTWTKISKLIQLMTGQKTHEHPEKSKKPVKCTVARSIKISNNQIFI